MSEIKDAILSDGVISISGECKGCDDCVKVCPAGAITVNGLGTKHVIDPSLCVNCGQCLITCPFARIEDVSMVGEVKEAMAAGKRVIVQEAPAVRVGLGEGFGMPEGSNVQGKMYAALRKLGFSEVYDTLFAADLTIMEEGFELIGRVRKALGVSGNEEAGPPAPVHLLLSRLGSLCRAQLPRAAAPSLHSKIADDDAGCHHQNLRREKA